MPAGPVGPEYPFAHLAAELLDPAATIYLLCSISFNSVRQKSGPDQFFDTGWYVDHNPDVVAGELNPSRIV
jgi:hypothetical protein